MLLIVLVLNVPVAEAQHVNLRVMNFLNNGENIQIHCKSRDDDLGVHQILWGNFYEFEFNVNLWQTTLFFCGFVFDDHKPRELHWFDIFIAERDIGDCKTSCWWKVYQDQLCLLDMLTDKYDKCYSWNTKNVFVNRSLNYTGNM